MTRVISNELPITSNILQKAISTALYWLINVKSVGQNKATR